MLKDDFDGAGCDEYDESDGDDDDDDGDDGDNDDGMRMVLVVVMVREDRGMCQFDWPGNGNTGGKLAQR